MGLQVGLNTYGYVGGDPIVFNDPLGLAAASTIGCDGKGENGDYEVINNNNKGCDSACTRAHEQSHIDDWKKKFGPGSCKNKPKGYVPAVGPDFLDRSECKAYAIGKECRQKMMGGGGACDCTAGIKRDDDQMKGLKCKEKGY